MRKGVQAGGTKSTSSRKKSTSRETQPKLNEKHQKMIKARDEKKVKNEENASNNNNKMEMYAHFFPSLTSFKQCTSSG